MTEEKKQLGIVVSEQAAILEQSAAALKEAQGRIPRPTPERVEQLRNRDRPMVWNEYILARLQRIGVLLEDIVTDLYTDLEYEFTPGPYDLIDVHALAAALEDDKERAESGDCW